MSARPQKLIGSVVALGTGLVDVGGSGVLMGGGRGMSANAAILGSSSAGSRELVSGISTSVLDSLGNSRMYASGGSRSMDRGVVDERGDMMDSRISGGGNMYGSSGGGGGRMSYDRGLDYDDRRSLDYDRGDRGGSDPYARSDICTVFVKNVSCLHSSRNICLCLLQKLNRPSALCETTSEL